MVLECKEELTIRFYLDGVIIKLISYCYNFRRITKSGTPTMMDSQTYIAVYRSFKSLMIGSQTYIVIYRSFESLKYQMI